MYYENLENVFLALDKYNSSQSENYLTEAFVTSPRLLYHSQS